MQYVCPFHSSHEPTDHLDPLGGGYKCTTLTKKERKSSLKFFFTDAVATTLDSRQTLLYMCPKNLKYLINVFATSSLDDRVLQSSQNCSVFDSLYTLIWYFSVAELFYSHVEVYQVLLRTTLNFQSREQHLYTNNE